MNRFLLSVTTLFLPFTCFAQITISNVNHSVHSNNVLRYNVTFNTDVPAKSWVDYYFIDGVDTVWNRSHITDAQSTSHSINVIGLLPEMDYTYTVSAFDENGCTNGTGGTFLTDTLPANLPWLDSIWAGNDTNLPGYIMTNAQSISEKPYVIYDRKGRVIWYDKPDTSLVGVAHGRCRFNTYDAERRTVLATDCHRITEKTLDGTVLRDISLDNRTDLYLHHDLFYKSNGNIAAIMSQQRIINQGSVGGSQTQEVMGQGIIEIDPNDSIVWEWHNFEHFDTLNTPANGGYWQSIVGPNTSNWMHGNAIMEDDDGNYLMSFKIVHQVAKIDASSGSLLWKMGGVGGDIDVLPADEYGDQHCINKTPGSQYMIFDNTGLDSLSRVMQFDIDFGYATPMMFVTWSFTLPQDFYTDILGSGYRLPYGNTLIGSGRSGGVFEVDNAGNQQWMARQGDWVYRAYYVDQLYAPHADLTPGFASVICADDTAFTLTATPDGGQWSGPGIAGGVFDPATAGIGIHQLIYKYGYDTDTVMVDVQDPANCTASVQDLAFGENMRVYPNPFNESFTISLDLPQATQIEFKLLDITGKEIAILFDGTLNKGRQDITTDNFDIPAGAYILHATTADGVVIDRKVVKY